MVGEPVYKLHSGNRLLQGSELVLFRGQCG